MQSTKFLHYKGLVTMYFVQLHLLGPYNFLKAESYEIQLSFAAYLFV